MGYIVMSAKLRRQGAGYERPEFFAPLSYGRVRREDRAMELEKLKILAKDVVSWGNCDSAWLDHSEDEPAAVVGHISEDGDTYPVAVIDCDQYYEAQDSIKLARFYAAANPLMVLALIGRIAMLKTPNAGIHRAAESRPVE